MRYMTPHLCLLAALSLGTGPAPAAPTEQDLLVIMAPAAAQPRLSRDELALIYKLKKRFWDDGEHIHPVNLSAGHPLRRAFSAQVLGRSPEELEGYWRDQYFHGVLPPYVLASEEAVIRFVARTPGAIGYISHCQADQRVVVVMRLGGGAPCPRQTQ
jgi:ABC-type phosphate transport system substrate-binding protein